MPSGAPCGCMVRYAWDVPAPTQPRALTKARVKATGGKADVEALHSRVVLLEQLLERATERIEQLERDVGSQADSISCIYGFIQVSQKLHPTVTPLHPAAQ